MKFLIFDVETNGWSDPRVISLAWMLAHEDGSIIRQQYDLIKPDGWTIPEQPFWIDHGYNTAWSLKHGVPIDNVLNSFLTATEEASALVGHNLDFDIRVVRGEILRAGKQARSDLHQICTMKMSIPVCMLPALKGYNKPKLDELYRHLFQHEFDNAHNALADVIACKDCFFELVKRGHIDLKTIQSLKTTEV